MNAIITGATKGIGKAIAVNLAKNGYNLALCARNESDLKLLQQELSIYNTTVFTMVTDCCNKNEVLAFAEAAKLVLPKIDVLVNNVGVFIPGALLDENDESFEQQLQLNLNSAYYLAKYFGKIMRKQQSGHIFNICSTASIEIIENAGSYCVTKAAMLSLNNVLRKELAQHHVKVTAILPGATLTNSWSGTSIPPENFLKPEDIASTLYNILKLGKAANVEELIIKPINF